MKLYIDDLRFPSDNSWEIARNYNQAISQLSTNKVTTISFDHDLGLDENGNEAKSGYDVANWLEEQIYYGLITTIPEMVVHSANPTGKKRIEQVIQSIYRIANK